MSFNSAVSALHTVDLTLWSPQDVRVLHLETSDKENASLCSHVIGIEERFFFREADAGVAAVAAHHKIL